MVKDLKHHFYHEHKVTHRIALLVILIHLFIHSLIAWNILVYRPSDDVEITGIGAFYYDAMFALIRMFSASLALFFITLAATLMMLLANYNMKLRIWFIYILIFFFTAVVLITYAIGDLVVKLISHFEIELNALFSIEIGGWDLSMPLHMLASLPVMIILVLVAMLIQAAVMIPVKLPEIILWIDNLRDNHKSE